MKRTPPIRVEADASTITPELSDDDFRDVFGLELDAIPGETPVAYRLRLAFGCAGYRAVKVLEMQTHPVLAVHAVRREAQRIADARLFFKHVKNLLRHAGFPLHPDELTVAQDSAGILVAFQWHDSPIDYAAGLRQAELDAAEFADMPL